MSDDAIRYELIFRPLSSQVDAFAFPCDASGRVDLDALDQRARNDDLFARALVGLTFPAPAVRACSAQ